MKNVYSVNVGNIGNIACKDRQEAFSTFDEYVRQSESNQGRAGGESVFILVNGEPVKEFIGSIDLEEQD